MPLGNGLPADRDRGEAAASHPESAVEEITENLGRQVDRVYGQADEEDVTRAMFYRECGEDSTCVLQVLRDATVPMPVQTMDKDNMSR